MSPATAEESPGTPPDDQQTSYGEQGRTQMASTCFEYRPAWKAIKRLFMTTVCLLFVLEAALGAELVDEPRLARLQLVPHMGLRPQ